MSENQPQPPREPEIKSGSSSPSHEEKGELQREDSSSSDSSSITSEDLEVGEGDDKEKRIIRYKYCCKICKHPDKSKKACVCVVPLSQRRADLGDGCRNCGCLGCSKEDFISKGEDPEYHPQAKDRAVESTRRVAEKRERPRERSRSLKKKRNSPQRKMRSSKSRSRSPEIIDSFNMKFHNFDRSIIGNMIVSDFQVNPNLLGFAIPQRTYSYIFGKPR